MRYNDYTGEAFQDASQRGSSEGLSGAEGALDPFTFLLFVTVGFLLFLSGCNERLMKDPGLNEHSPMSHDASEQLNWCNHARKQCQWCCYNEDDKNSCYKACDAYHMRDEENSNCMEAIKTAKKAWVTYQSFVISPSASEYHFCVQEAFNYSYP